MRIHVYAYGKYEMSEIIFFRVSLLRSDYNKPNCAYIIDHKCLFCIVYSILHKSVSIKPIFKDVWFE